MDRKPMNFHVAMYPWFAFGHLLAFLHAANKLADRGHKISFLLPTKTQIRLQPFNLHPNLITFIPITVPHVQGLPEGVETTADVPFPLHQLIMTAMDLTQPIIDLHLRALKPQFVFFDFTHWIPKLTRSLGIKSVLHCIISPATIGYLLSPERQLLQKHLTPASLMTPPPGFPSSKIKLRAHEARGLTATTIQKYGIGVSFHERQIISFSDCDAIGFKTCREMEGDYCDYIEDQFKKPVILAGPVLPETPSSVLDGKLGNWLAKFDEESVIFCSFGSECVLAADQYKELLLGLDQTGLPFLVALRPPSGADSLESALPEGLLERVEGRGFVEGGWVQQNLILRHPSVGCFVTHCGSGSLSEGMVSKCQLVLVPYAGDQIINARLMGGDLKVGVEVDKGEEDGLFTKEGVCTAIRIIMDVESEIGKEVRENHAKWRNFLLSDGIEGSYVDGFVNKLEALLD